MARIDKRQLTRLEIIQVASRKFLEKGYSRTTVAAISKELGMSPGNLTFHFPTKEHLLAELVDLLCSFQWHRMEEEAQEGVSSIMALCLDVTAMVSASEGDPVIRDFFLSAYSSPMCLNIIRRNDTDRARKVFGSYQPDWTDKQFAEAELICSGIEYAVLMTAEDPVTLESRISAALNNILRIYGVPEELRQTKIRKVFTMDHKNLGKRVLREFREYVEQANEQAMLDLVKR